jgi:hypothetical protein
MMDSGGDVRRDFSFPVTASEMARRPKDLLEIGLTGNSQSVPRSERASGDLGKIALS